MIDQEVMAFVNDLNPEPEAWISPATPPTSENRTQQERVQKAHRNWRVREQNVFFMIQINMNKETSQCYDDIKMSSSFLEKIRENSTKMMRKDTEL